jgi:adenine-specific DNA-methyltransferase
MIRQIYPAKKALPQAFKIAKRLSYGEEKTDNLILQGENGDALEFLESQYQGKVDCVYLDPPYNNSEEYTHYSDSKAHEDWLLEITSTLKHIKPLLSGSGSVWISIDDGEMHYLKVAADKIFGRENFVTTIIWQHRTTRENRKVFSNNHEYILIYARNQKLFKAKRNLLPIGHEVIARYKNPDNDPRGAWQSISANVQAGHGVENQFYEIKSPSGHRHTPPNGRCWVYNKKRMLLEIEKNNIWFGSKGNGVPRIKKFLSSASIGLTPETLWMASDVGTTKDSKKHLLSLFPNEPVFDTPKPESLLDRVISIATNKGDLVLDPYLGSGSTIAAAHKMGRNYIGIERGSHAFSLAVSRLRKVIAGEEGGISGKYKWNGGGGFKFFKIERAVAPLQRYD